jgi:hypothetical protein
VVGVSSVTADGVAIHECYLPVLYYKGGWLVHMGCRAAAPTELLRKIKIITAELGYNVLKGTE